MIDMNNKKTDMAGAEGSRKTPAWNNLSPVSFERGALFNKLL